MSNQEKVLNYVELAGAVREDYIAIDLVLDRAYVRELLEADPRVGIVWSDSDGTDVWRRV